MKIINRKEMERKNHAIVKELLNDIKKIPKKNANENK